MKAQTLADLVGTYCLSIKSDENGIIFSKDNDSIFWNYRKKKHTVLDRLDSIYLQMYSTDKLTIRSDSTYQFILSLMNEPSKSGEGKVNMLENHIFLFPFPSSDYIGTKVMIFEYKVINHKVQLKSKEKDYKIYLKE